MSPTSAKIALEDNFEDVIAKAQKGLGLTPEVTVKAAGITPAALTALREGKLDEPALTKLAPVLQLHAPSLLAIARKKWYPRIPSLTSLAQINTPYERGILVNAYLVWDPSSHRAVLFDTGVDAAPILALVKANQLRVELILLTHTHGDHVACLGELQKSLGSPKVYVSARENFPAAQPLADGATFSLGPLHIEARRTSGHAPGGLTFVVRGLQHPIAVVGDALFAGSMGGARTPETYTEALTTNRAAIFSLPSDTILCPGHGPLSTVDQEKQHNPFYPELK